MVRHEAGNSEWVKGLGGLKGSCGLMGMRVFGYTNWIPISFGVWFLPALRDWKREVDGRRCLK